MTSFLNCIKSIYFKSLDLLGAFDVFSVITYHVIELFAWKTFPNLDGQADLDSRNWPHLTKLFRNHTQHGAQLHQSFPGNIGAKL